MGSLNAIGIDLNKANSGVLFQYHAGITLRIARFDNGAYKEHVRKAMKPHTHAIQHDMLPEGVAEKIAKEAAAKHILVGWESVTDDNGNIVEYSPERALAYFNDPKLADFFKDVTAFSRQLERYRIDSVERTEGN